MVDTMTYPKLSQTPTVAEMAQAINELSRTLTQRDRTPISPYQANGRVSLAGDTATYQMQPDDGVILVKTDANPVAVYLRNANENGQNVARRITVKKISGGNNVTVYSQSPETIDGVASVTISTLFNSFEFASDGYNWFII